MLRKTISNLVVTPNFDDFISRALHLFGQPHVVCDHPSTIDRIDCDEDAIQITHVHGTYWFYDCCNLSGEITERAKRSENTNATMASFLDRVLAKRSPIVLGYAGWANDVIMTALKRRLGSRLPYNLYWFCYSEDDAACLPSWLTEHPDVYVAGPTSNPAFAGTGNTAPTSKEELSSPPTSAIKKKTTDQSPRSQFLNATDVLDRLIQLFQAAPPALISDPLSFLAERLANSLPAVQHATDSDIYFIGSTVERIRRADRVERESTQHSEQRLESVRNSLRRSEYREAILDAQTIRLDDFDSAQKHNLLLAIFVASARLLHQQQIAIAGYQLCLSIGASLSRDRFSDHAATALSMAYRSLFELFEDSSQFKKLIQTADQFLKEFGNTRDLAGIDALFVRTRRADAMAQEGELVQAISEFDRIIAACDKTQQGGRLNYARAQHGKGGALLSRKKAKPAHLCHQSIVSLFQNSSDELERRLFVQAQINCAICLKEQHKSNDANLALDKVSQDHLNSTDTRMRQYAYDTLCMKASWQLSDKQVTRAIQTYEKVLELAQKDGSPDALNVHAKTLIELASIAYDQGKSTEEIQHYETLISLHRNSTDHRVRQHVVGAHYNIAVTLEVDDKFEESAKRYTEVTLAAGESLDPAILEFGLRARAAQANIIAKLGRWNEASSLFKKLSRDASEHLESIAPYMNPHAWLPSIDMISFDQHDLNAGMPFLEALSRQKFQADVDHGIKASLQLHLLGLGRFDDASKIFANGKPKPDSLEIRHAFNHAMSLFALRAPSARSFFERVAALDKHDDDITKDANYLQCLAFVHYMLGNEIRALRLVDKAKKKVARQEFGEFSCWRYLRLAQEEFIKDCDELRAFIQTRAGGPRFLRRA